jgi:hypothetical protein
MLLNIPAEMRVLNQWVAADQNKRPYHPVSYIPASVVDPRTWGTFEQAAASGAPFVGFVLTAADPYAIIDLDNKTGQLDEATQKLHDTILHAFPSYTERSASGCGFHIVVRGALPAGLHRGSVEAYSSARYMICTGNVIRNAPIIDCQSMLMSLSQEMRSRTEIELVEVACTVDDSELLERATCADNGEKFVALCNGRWQDLGYPSQSEADFALLSILCFYSKSNEQVRRLFLMSGLGKREKAHTEYLDRCLRRIRASEVPAADIQLKPLAPVEVAAPTPAPEPPAPTKQLQPPLPYPPGLIGDLARYIYSSSIKPVSEIALCASVALMAGITGRAYNFSGTGLNQYLVIVAKTGAGKEGAASGIDRLVAAVRPQVPAIDTFIGPGAFASGQALARTLDERPVFLSVLGEFGFTLKQITDPRANSAVVMLRRMLLDLFGKSGAKSVLRESVYSDKERNTKIIHGPSVSLLGEATPESFFEGLTSRHIAEGLVSRFSIIEYKGDRPPTNETPGLPPDPSLVNALATIAATCLAMQQNSSVCSVPCEGRAKVILKAFDTEADAHINGNSGEVDRQLWNRAHLKALKLSALVAVGLNPSNPLVTMECVEWALAWVRRELADVLDRYSTGAIGESTGRLDFHVLRVVGDWAHLPRAKRSAIGCIPDALLTTPWVPYRFVKKRCLPLVDFQTDKRGPIRALRETLDDMASSGELVQMNKEEAIKKYGAKAGLYQVGK